MSQALIGLPALIFLAWLTSSEKRRFPLRLVLTGVALQWLLLLALLNLPPFATAMLWLNETVLAVEAATRAGTSMVFGFLGGGPPPYIVTDDEYSFVLAFRALPIVLVFAALSALLWHWRITPVFIRVISRLLQRSLGLGGAAGVGAASSVFVGMVEAPLLIKPHLRHMPAGELFIVMTCGMATVAGTVLGLYASILSDTVPLALSHLLIASLISAPAAILLAAIMIPPTRQSNAQTADFASPYSSTMDAITQGTQEGLKLLASIVGMLIVFVALVHLIDALLGLFPTSGDALTLTGALGTIMMPLAWLLGIPWSEAAVAGELLATKVAVNELVAFVQLAALDEDVLSETSRLILTYALCGFANLGSLGIMIGGMTAMCPQRRTDIVRLAPRAVWSGFLATCMTGCLVGLTT